MGSDDHYPEEAPAHWAAVEGFWMDRTPVTNAQFLKFVKATGHITLAERAADPADYPGAPPERLRPASIVFVPPRGPVPLSEIHRWWHDVFGADWRHPEGPGSSIKGREKHPVVHIADADAYAYWAGKQLPSERQWERAARGGLDHDTAASSLSPAGCCQAAEQARLASIDPSSEHGSMPRKVVKGGSYLCAPDYCQRYRPAARMAQGIDTSTGHMGFRCVMPGGR